MNAPRLLLAIVALGLLGLVGFFLFGSDGNAPPIEFGDANESRESDPTGAVADSSEPVVEADTPRREEIPANAVLDGSGLPMDPAIRAALAGFRGRLVTPEGTAIEQVEVELFRFAADSVISRGATPFLAEHRSEPEVDAGDTKSDGEGRFEITGVWPRGFYLLRAGRTSDTPLMQILERSPGPGEMIDLGDLVMNPSGVLVGKVLDDDGRPCAGALVRAADVPGEMLGFVPIERFDPEGGLIVTEAGGLVLECPDWVKRRFDQLPIPTTHTGEDGTFRLTGLTAGSNVVVINARDHTPLIKSGVRVRAGEEKDVGELSLRSGELVYGKVLDTDEQPIEGAEVLVAATSSVMPVHFAQFAPNTNAEGEFELEGFPNGNVIVAARRDADDPWVLSEAVPILRDVIVHLPAAHEVHVTITSTAGIELGEPRFQLSPGKLSEGAVEMAMWGATNPLPLEARLGKHPERDNTWTLTGIPEGSYALLVDCENHAMGATQLEVKDGVVELAVELGPDNSFEVRVEDDQGQPIRSAAVYVMARGRPRVPEMPLRGDDTDEHGRAKIDGLLAKKVRITASHPAFGNAHAETEIPPPAPIVLRFATPGQITGTLTEAGRTPTPGKWVVTIERRRGSGVRGAMPDIPKLVAPDLDGNFTALGLTPGEYRVEVMESLKVLQSPGGFMGMMQTAWMNQKPRTTVTVVPGATTIADLDTEQEEVVEGPAAGVTGTVIAPGIDLSELTMMTWAGGKRRMCQVEANGRFDLGRLSVGNISIKVYRTGGNDGVFRPRSETLWSTNIELKENADQDLTIEIALSTAVGTVIGLRGEQISDCRVTASGNIEGGGTVWRRSTADSTGRFEFKQLPVGTYSFAVETEQVRGKIHDVQISAGSPATDLRIQVESTITVAGTVDISKFGEVDWMWMRWSKTESENTTRKWVPIERDGTGSFSTTEIESGTWTITFQGPVTPDGKTWKGSVPVTIGPNGASELHVIPLLVDDE